MATMSHTPAQRKDWHEGKKQAHQTPTGAIAAAWKKGNYRGAFTPTAFKRGILYRKV